MLNGCLFAARLRPGRAERTLLLRRVAALERFYGVLGRVHTRMDFDGRLGLLTGTMSFGGEVATGEVLAWGTAPPAALARAEQLLGAGDAQLRALPVPAILIGAEPGRARIVAAAGGTAPLYASSSDTVDAWSSHAVAAAYLAGGTVSVDPDAIPHLMTAEFLGGGSTIVREARALPPAIAIEIDADGARERCYWPAAERWARLPPQEAQEAAERALLVSLERGLDGAPAPILGLTAGLDSMTVAVALREIGSSFSTFTYVVPIGSADSESDPEVRGARGVAEALGIAHEVGEIEWWDDSDGLARLHAEARWHEAGAPVGYGEVPWPARLSHWIRGLGAETGRSFYYGWVRPRGPGSTRLAKRVLTAYLQTALVDAEPEVRRRERERWHGWVEAAAGMGGEGLDALDVVYAEQRVRRWGRGMAPRIDAACVPAMADQELMRALASLPLEERLTDGFPRRFVASRRPDLAPELPKPRRGRPGATLARRRASHAARLLRRTSRLPAPSTPVPWVWFHASPWDERPRLLEWMTDEVLRSPLAATALGDRWLSEQRRRFLRGEAAARDLTLWVASAVALDAALREWLEHERSVAHGAPDGGDELDHVVD